jgi:hypothetical protein
MNWASKWTSWVVDLWTVITEHQTLKTVNSTSLVWTWNIAVQPTLVSWTNIKTVNSTSLLGSWNIAVQPTLVSWTNIKTVWGVTLLWSWDVSIWVTSVNWNTWAVTVNAYAPWNTWTTGQVLTKTASGYEYQNAPVTSVNGSTWAVTGLQTTSNLKTSLSDNSDSYYPSQKAVKTAVDGKQPTLVSWTNIKTINWNSILGSGNITVSSSTTTTCTLTSAWWSSKSQTVSVTGVTASNTVIVSPAPDYIDDYADCWVYGYWQWSWTLTFKCGTVPSGDIVVNVLIFN